MEENELKFLEVDTDNGMVRIKLSPDVWMFLYPDWARSLAEKLTVASYLIDDEA